MAGPAKDAISTFTLMVMLAWEAGQQGCQDSLEIFMGDCRPSTDVRVDSVLLGTNCLLSGQVFSEEYVCECNYLNGNQTNQHFSCMLSIKTAHFTLNTVRMKCSARVARTGRICKRADPCRLHFQITARTAVIQTGYAISSKITTSQVRPCLALSPTSLQRIV